MGSDSCDASEKEMRARDDENADLKTRTRTRGLELAVSDSSMTELSLGSPGILFILPALRVSRTGLSVCIGSDSSWVHAPNYFITYPSLKRVILHFWTRWHCCRGSATVSFVKAQIFWGCFRVKSSITMIMVIDVVSRNLAATASARA